ncbi:GNAT family N-acetyltransferase [Dyadobacter fanqingshengii]|uniref:GNAT family N-acetyltransferase n=1 Tax=Dyadobacter fanqingshengii TaxID=2906443 RepID=A0A9X1T6V4_9BACT|nr:GNAT family N-acetyltransferase [Dyadobacter fanqingshengii]MCF0038480.1 GNAT family N-acetyltransferase [Dyadobacter fanqingshengii]MCF2503992.1 GNAT family N-acetyltransferase [Dyadobacter fanqingshengii]USJ34685.1 GNAT family N-acetyltransferase [Dyadobacter fanqingshengii]
MTNVQIVKTEGDIQKCRRAIQALRPQLVDDLYLEAVKKTLADKRQIIFIEENDEAAAVAVFETGYNLFRGNYIYIDDLSTLPEQRGKGYAGILIDWILDFAEKENYAQVHLDSGVSEARTDAHRLYLNKRFQVTSLHFVTNI